MENSTQINEEIKGMISVKLANNQTLDDFCADHIVEYNKDRFEAFAIRLFLGNESIVTVYALDKIRQEDSTTDPDRFPVKKFKLSDFPISSIFSYFSSFNCTLSNGNYNIEEMEVMNK